MIVNQRSVGSLGVAEVSPAEISAAPWPTHGQRWRLVVARRWAGALCVGACPFVAVRSLLSGLDRGLFLDPLPAEEALVHSALTYLWVPVEYNQIQLPAALGIVIVAASGLLLVAGLAGLRSNSSSAGVALVMTVAVVSVAAWAWTAELQQAVAFRTAYLALPAYALMGVATGLRLGARRLAAGAWGLLIVLHLWTLISTASTAYPPGVQL